MFRSSLNRWRAWIGRFEDILGDPPHVAPPHPHRRPLRWEHTRRHGSVPARPAHCISPVVRGGERRTDRSAVEQ